MSSKNRSVSVDAATASGGHHISNDETVSLDDYPSVEATKIDGAGPSDVSKTTTFDSINKSQ